MKTAGWFKDKEGRTLLTVCPEFEVIVSRGERTEQGVMHSVRIGSKTIVRFFPSGDDARAFAAGRAMGVAARILETVQGLKNPVILGPFADLAELSVAPDSPPQD